MDNQSTEDEAPAAGPALNFLAIHAVAGPLAGTATLLLYGMVMQLTTSRFVAVAMPPWYEMAWRSIAPLFVIMMFGWMLGMVPAALHALVMLALRRPLRQGPLWFVAAPVIGGVISCAMLWLLSFMLKSDWSPVTDIRTMLPLFPVGAVGALASMLIAWRSGLLARLKKA